MESLDNILSGKGEAAPAPVVEEKTEAVTQETEGATEAQTGAEPQDEVSDHGGKKMVPLEALTETRGKVKRYTEEVADLRKEIADRDAAWERRIAALMQSQQPKAEPQPKPDWFENPEAATQHVVAPHLEQFGQQLLAIAKDNAIVRFTEEKVNGAEQAFLSAMQSRTLDPADYHKVVNSPNRYAAAVQWHQRQLAQAEIGDDPAAFRAKVEAETEAKILEKYGIKPGETQKPAPVMPTPLTGARNVGNRSGPAWGGPPTLADILAPKR